MYREAERAQSAEISKIVRTLLDAFPVAASVHFGRTVPATADKADYPKEAVGSESRVSTSSAPATSRIQLPSSAFFMLQVAWRGLLLSSRRGSLALPLCVRCASLAAVCDPLSASANALKVSCTEYQT